ERRLKRLKDLQRLGKLKQEYGELPEDLDDLTEAERWQFEDDLVERVTMAENMAELEAEIEELDCKRWPISGATGRAKCVALGAQRVARGPRTPNRSVGGKTTRSTHPPPDGRFPAAGPSGRIPAAAWRPGAGSSRPCPPGGGTGG